MTNPATHPVTVIATMRAKPGNEARVRELLQALVAPTRAEAGCMNYDLHESPEHPGSFMFHENWTTVAALEAHLKMPYIQELVRLTPEILEEHAQITQWQRLRP